MSAAAGVGDAHGIDPITGLLDDHGFAEAFDRELERAGRTDQPLSLIVGVLDALDSADWVEGTGSEDALRRAADVIRSAKRSWDSAAHLEGHELLLLAPDTDEHGAYVLAERVRTAIEPSLREEGAQPPTASFGIVTSPIHGQTPEILMQAARQALDAARSLGRNRSVISSAEVPGILTRASGARGSGQVELATLLKLAEALDVRDSGSASHCRRVGRLCELIARELELAPESVERVRIAGVLHDVGRVGVPDEVMDKPGPLSDDEWLWVRSHPEIGARMLATTDFCDIGEWILAHHERPDGQGYPSGRRGEDVPIEAAIIGVADAYEAMTASRPYRDALEPNAASEELRRCAGAQFDERVVHALLTVV